LLIDKIDNPEVHKLMLTNSFVACEKQITKAISELKPNYVLSFGQKPDTDCLYIETTAKCSMDSLMTNYDINELMQSLENSGVSYRSSDNAGTYLCNHVYYTGLDYIRRNSFNTKMIFIHVPNIKRFNNIADIALFFNKYIEPLQKNHLRKMQCRSNN